MRVPAAVLVTVSLASTLALVASQGRAPAGTARPAAAVTKDVTVHEGTSMSVAVSPDGRRLAVDFQGSVWVLPAAGGTATRITDVFNDARQPAWSPDGQAIAFFAYRDGGYDLWAVTPDGTNQRKLTTGAYDDREPVWSHDGIICTFEPYKDKVKLTFPKGASLKDPDRLFNSSLEGNVRRAIDIREQDTVNESAFKALIRQAIALNSSGKTKPKRTR